jgi:hypothetical protein
MCTKFWWGKLVWKRSVSKIQKEMDIIKMKHIHSFKAVQWHALVPAVMNLRLLLAQCYLYRMEDAAAAAV